MMEVLNGLDLFAGIGGIAFGLKRTGVARSVCYVENDRYAQGVLQARMRDGQLDEAPIWDDIATFDGRPWRGVVDLVAGGFPCQDISLAGRGEGIKGKRSGLWAEMFRIIREVRPSIIIVENVPALLGRGLGRILGDLAEGGFDAEWDCIPASAVGAPHRRDRIWIVAYPNRCEQGRGNESKRSEDQRNPDTSRNGAKRIASDVAYPQEQPKRTRLRKDEQEGQRIGRFGDSGGEVPDAERERLEGIKQARPAAGPVDRSGDGSDRTWWTVEPDVGRVVNGLPNRMDRLRCLGNSVVPQCVEYVAARIKQRLLEE